MTEQKTPWRLINVPSFCDWRGTLSVLEKGLLPFSPKRCYWIHRIPIDAWRGRHAHKENDQLLICMQGECKVLLCTEHRAQQAEVHLRTPDEVLFIPRLVWHEIHGCTKETLLLLLASEEYDPQDYIQEQERYL